jgi:2-keto-4-pentenoate hydratase
MQEILTRALASHLERFRRAAATEGRLGWKVAFNAPAIQARLGLDGSLVAGLTEATLEIGDGPHALTGSTRLALEAEVAVWLARDLAPNASVEAAAAAIEAWAPAVELVDFDRPLDQLEQVLVEGVFHRALRLGERRKPAPGADLRGQLARVEHGGALVCEVDAREATGHAPEVLLHLSRLLAPHGEGLCAGDLVILGAMNPLTFAEAGKLFSLQLGTVGSVRVPITA